MPEIKRITISGFRGIRTSLDLNFQKGSSIRSMIIYGRNGTGKSSITDAWEWFHTEKIEHLRREGAREGSYPHKFSVDGETFVEIDFNNPSLGTQRLKFNHSRITIPSPLGDIVAFRHLAPHPCHISFKDLTNFVYKSKTEKFDALALLMGFMPQVGLQKSLRRVLRKFNEHGEEKTAIYEKQKIQLLNLLDLDELNESNFLSSINAILAKYKIPESKSLDSLKDNKNKLNQMVVDDPIAQEISDLISIEKILKLPDISNEFEQDFSDFLVELKRLVSNKQELSKLLLLKLFEQGDSLLSQVDEEGNNLYKKMTGLDEDEDTCPLCGQKFPGDLEEHIATETKKLQEIKNNRDTLSKARKKLHLYLPNKSDFIISFDSLGDRLHQFDEQYSLSAIILKAENVENLLTNLRDALAKEIDKYSDQHIADLEKFKSSLIVENNNLKTVKFDSLKKINNRIRNLSEEKSNRSELVNDNTTVTRSFDSFIELQKEDNNLQLFEQRQEKFEKIVDNFIHASIKNVDDRFKIISHNVNSYFEILEKDTPGLRNAKLRLLPDEDRAVVLEVGFHDDTIYPAYKFLSESQLNSFGLSVFLASTKYFNSDFKFIILDDIINSFDGYKRPRIIELLRKEFSTHQILLLTHDNVWRDRLFEAFPASIKKRFTRWEINHGPIVAEGFTPLEKIQQFLDDDDPVLAGQNLGPTLERFLQEIAEKFEVLVKYNRINEYTLSPLLQRFSARVKVKLGTKHPLYRAIKALEEESGFRNLCSHWKNPAIQLTREEMQETLNKWLVIESYAKCQDANCLNWLEYDKASSSFICPCGKSSLYKIDLP